jgi:hypothetical protein
MMARNTEGDEESKLTAAGCVLALFTIAVIFGVAIPIVHWRDPDTKQPIPREAVIAAPFVIGAVFHGIGILLLRLVGLRIWSKSDTEDSSSSEE